MKNGKPEDGQVVGPPTPENPIQLLVIFDGINVGVKGPVGNKLLCLGMLELAKSSVIAYQPPKESPLLKPAHPGVIPMPGVPPARA